MLMHFTWYTGPFWNLDIMHTAYYMRSIDLVTLNNLYNGFADTVTTRSLACMHACQIIWISNCRVARHSQALQSPAIHCHGEIHFLIVISQSTHLY